MSANSQSLNTDTFLLDDFQIDTPEKRLLFQSLAQKLFHRVFELNLSTPHDIHFQLADSSLDDLEDPAVSVDIYWYVNNDKDRYERPTVEYSCGYSWLSTRDIQKWFLDANIGLDLLVAENKAA